MYLLKLTNKMDTIQWWDERCQNMCVYYIFYIYSIYIVTPLKHGRLLLCQGCPISRIYLWFLLSNHTLQSRVSRWTPPTVAANAATPPHSQLRTAHQNIDIDEGIHCKESINNVQYLRKPEVVEFGPPFFRRSFLSMWPVFHSVNYPMM